MTILETQELTHVFPDGTVAIRDINLKVKAGEFIVLAGANGSGKPSWPGTSTVCWPTKGRVLLTGTGSKIRRPPEENRTGFQDPDSQFVGQTVAEDVAFGPKILTCLRPKWRLVKGLGRRGLKPPSM